MGRESASGGEEGLEELGLRAAVDPATEDGRVFFQSRVSLFGKWLFVASAFFYLVANVPLDVFMGLRELDWVEEWFGFKEQLMLGTVAVTGAMWLATRGAERSAQELQAIDLLGSVIVAGLVAGLLLERTPVVPAMFQVTVVLLACTNLVIARAIVIPSTVRRTIVISSLAFLPAIGMIAYSMSASVSVSTLKSSHTTVAAVMWGAIAISSAATTSRILFRLRRQVSQAAQLGHYVLEEEIGRGGMGVVYKARHATLRRPTAIKLLSPARTQEVDMRRFEREVQCTADLTHPNTVAIYDYGHTPSGVFYCAMEFIEGISLQELVEQWGPLPPGRVVHILQQVCGALSEAHHEGLIHRDVKPANIMLCERGLVADVAKVLDFGLVKETLAESDEDDSSLSLTSVVGTPAYLSPEAIEDPSLVDSRSDLYAVGAVGYFLLTGTPLFEGESTVSICVQHLNAEPVPPSERLGKPMSGDLERILLSCVEKDPEQRPRGAGELAAALGSCEGVGAWSKGDASRWWKEHRDGIMPRKPQPVGHTLTINLDERNEARARGETN